MDSIGVGATATPHFDRRRLSGECTAPSCHSADCSWSFRRSRSARERLTRQEHLASGCSVPKLVYRSMPATAQTVGVRIRGSALAAAFKVPLFVQYRATGGDTLSVSPVLPVENLGDRERSQLQLSLSLQQVDNVIGNRHLSDRRSMIFRAAAPWNLSRSKGSSLIRRTRIDALRIC